MYIRAVLYLTLSILHLPVYALRETSYVGKLLFNKEISDELHEHTDNLFPIYYKGGIFYGSPKGNALKYELTGSPHINCLYILVTDQPPLPKTLDEENLRLSSKAHYKFYKLMRKIRPIEDGYEYFWQILQTPLKENLVLPDSTIIILADPRLVDKIEGVSWKEGMLVSLPSIYFDKTLSGNKIKDLIDYAHCLLPDLKNCHRKERPIKICKDNCILSMPQNILL